MSFTIFYSWQSDTDVSCNKHFIEGCLKKAVKRLKEFYKDESIDFYIDRDTKGVPGFPNIPATIDEKIGNCDLFIGDLTFLGQLRGKNLGNQNVALELGQAMGMKIEDRVVNVLNSFYGSPSEGGMPFDIDQRRWPFEYHLTEGHTKDEAKEVEAKLVGQLYGAVKTVFDSLQERRKKENAPFETWNSWNSLAHNEFSFETNPYLDKICQTFHEDLKKKNAAFRLLGLSGIGKTNLMLQFFTPGFMGLDASVTSKVIYADLNDCEEAEILAKIKALFLDKQHKIIVLDNCPLTVHGKLLPLILNTESNLKLITISPEPDESKQEIDTSGQTTIIKLESKEFKPIVNQLLAKNFSDLSDDDRNLIVEYSNGLPFFAVLMARNREETRTQPGSLTPSNILSKLLGGLYTDVESKKVLLACSIFSTIGFLDHQSGQEVAVALCDELCDLNEKDEELRVRHFQSVREVMQNRQLLEKIGFSYSFRPTPLALKLAEIWWEKCSTSKFEKIIPVLQDAGLVEKFCQQFRFLSHISHAKQIVGRLCEGVFSNAEVLNTEVGSRLFRSFVNVNPLACAEALTKAFGGMSIDDLKKINIGRRNLVWALEQLCFISESFEKSIIVLAGLAAAENENLGNNATQQFLQLFHIQLPGTSVNLERRKQIISYLISKDGAYRELGILAATRAMKGDNFSRMVGAEEIRSDSPKDYQASYREIGDYWAYALDVLREEVRTKSSQKQMAIEGIVNRLYSFTEQGLSELILPVVKELYENGDVAWPELRNKIQFIIGHNRIFDEDAKNKLELLMEEITPSTFEARFEIYVKNPSSEEYFRKGEDGETDRNYLPGKVKETAHEFMLLRRDWAKLLPFMVNGHIAEGMNFGSEMVGELNSDEIIEEFITAYLHALKLEVKDRRNISIAIGIFRNMKKTEWITHFYRRIKLDKELQYLEFAFAQNIPLQFPDLFQLLEDVKSGRSNVEQFSTFTYGWGLRHLPTHESDIIIKGIIDQGSEGKAVGFTILYTWSYNEQELKETFRPMMRKLIFDNSIDLVDHLQKSTELYSWSETCKYLLSDSNDNELADKLTTVVIDLANRDTGYYRLDNNLHLIIDVLQEEYFPIFWSNLSEMYLNKSEYELAKFHFRELLGSKYDYYKKTEGLLFKGHDEKTKEIFEWAKQNKGKDINFLGGLIPLYANEITKPAKWHPTALMFINEFGDDIDFLHEISAKIGSYSWVNSVVPKIKIERDMYESLIDHSSPVVRKWAQDGLSYALKRIEFEVKSDEEDFYRFK